VLLLPERTEEAGGQAPAASGDDVHDLVNEPD
jgi:hypothetical protein